MKFRINSTLKSVLISGTVILSFIGCAKNTIIYEYGGGESGQSDNNNNQTNTLVSFNASVESRNLTRSMSPLKKGIQSRLFAYKTTAGNNAGETLSAQGLYITSSPGILTGTDGYKMYLSNGIYNFYAVSDNFSTIPPTFSGGESEPLFNGIDYLWWECTQQDVISSQINIPIVYQHAGTQVVFKVSAGESLQLDKLVSAMITPSEPGASMSLNTGVIPPAIRYGKADKMGINQFTAQYIMLPLKTDTPMTLTLEILADGETATRTYTAQVPVPSGELKAGDSYVFSAVIDGNKVQFPSVSVSDWTEVDETGSPIYPTQK